MKSPRESSCRGLCLLLPLLLCWTTIGAVELVHAAEPFAVLHEVTAAQRLSLEQLDQLRADNQVDDVIRLAQRLIDEADGRLLAVPRGAELEGEAVRFVPLQLFLQDRLLRWGETDPKILAGYRQRADAIAQRRLAVVAEQRDLVETRRLVDDVFATRVGDDALLLLGDLLLQHGDVWGAIAAWRRIDPRWQAAAIGAPAEEVAALGWEGVLPRLKLADFESLLSASASFLQPKRGWPLGCYINSDLNQVEVGLRLVSAFRLAGEEKTAERLTELVKRWHPTSSVWQAGREQPLAAALAAIRSDAAGTNALSVERNLSDWNTLGRDGCRVYHTGPLKSLPGFPSWQVELPAADLPMLDMSTELPLGAAGIARANGDLEGTLVRSLPVIHDGVVIVQRGRQMVAYELKSGISWPSGSAAFPLLVDADNDQQTPKSLPLPADGQVWYTLSAANNRVVGRFGPPESGWLQVLQPQRSLSRIMALDLNREGQLMEGYPAAVADLGRDGWELEGTPLIVGDRLYAGLSRRGQATLENAVGCLDLASGQWLFVTVPLGNARPLELGTRNRLASSLVSYRSGVIYYHGDCGTVAAFDSEAGKLLWSFRYRRAPLAEGGYPRRLRGRRIQSSPVAIVGSMVIVMAADLDRLLALDSQDGRLLWATPLGVAADVDQVLGVAGDNLIVGGDSLYWIDRWSGNVQVSWPAGTTSQPNGSLPQPRRAGRGLMAGSEICWPTAEAIWVFDGQTSAIHGAEVAVPRRRIDLKPWGVQGGDLVAADGTLVMTSGRTLLALVGSGDSDQDGISH